MAEAGLWDTVQEEAVEGSGYKGRYLCIAPVRGSQMASVEKLEISLSKSVEAGGWVLYTGPMGETPGVRRQGGETGRLLSPTRKDPNSRGPAQALWHPSSNREPLDEMGFTWAQQARARTSSQAARLNFAYPSHRCQGPMATTDRDEWTCTSRDRDEWTCTSRDRDEWTCASRDRDEWTCASRDRDEWTCASRDRDEWTCASRDRDEWTCASRDRDEWTCASRDRDEWTCTSRLAPELSLGGILATPGTGPGLAVLFVLNG
ncbi:hypothetical protein P7K49_004418 [Saguinus oedipus]|uniref:Uncharacterized protein n=1 Tax=Saguinus oedipus TaxID=9490 RepID=A0ABQ9WAV9_SAGOE|nr:hypothetical protein P7K49_004418 [Saguinus oedipus]